MLTQDNEITQLLRRWQVGDRDAESRIFELLLPQLHLIAARCFRGENSGHSLQPTALVNEAFLKLAAARNIDWQDRGHFLAMAARFMRRYLIDHARAASRRCASSDGWFARANTGSTLKTGTGGSCRCPTGRTREGLSSNGALQ